MKLSLIRPIHLLFTEPIILVFAMWIGFCWGVMYLGLEAVPDVLTVIYQFNTRQVGLSFLTIMGGGLIAFVGGPVQDALYRKNVKRKGVEARLYAPCLGGLLIPTGLFLFAFSTGRTSVAGPLVGLVVLFAGISTVYTAMFQYISDTYTTYASSALASTSLTRNLGATAFPLFASSMYSATLLAGGVGALLAVLPFILLRFGARIRSGIKLQS
ncbi:hypothetical protein RQP46_009263 [Phenoliferia psychrophenolica]